MATVRVVRSLGVTDLIRFVAWCALVGGSSAVAAQEMPAPTSYESVYEALADLRPTTEQAQVSNVTFRRDVATFELVSGTLYALSPVEGVVPGVVFIGNARFMFEPPTFVEREALERRTDRQSLDVRAEAIVFIFGDETWHELTSHVTFAHGPEPRDARGKVDDAVDEWREKKQKLFPTGILSTFLNGVRNDLFYARVFGDGGPYWLEISPYDQERVQLLMPARKGPRRGEPEVVSQFEAGLGRPAAKAVVTEDPIVVDRYVIESRIESNKRIRASAHMSVTGQLPGHAWIPFFMYPGIEVDSVTWEDGTVATAFQGDESPYTWVRFEPALEPGATRQVSVHYHGDVLQETGEWLGLIASSSWYPSHGDRRPPAIFDLTFTHTDRLRLVAVGDLRDERRTSGSLITRWVTPNPIRYASFSIGRFHEYVIDFPGIPKTTVLTPLGTARDVGRDVANSMQFFQQWFGEPITEHIWATSIPFGHGQGFPGLLHLSQGTFSGAYDDPEMLEWFRAHEAAHQWWGNGVSFRTYRDQWLDEGLASFSALLFILHVGREPEIYDRMLRDYRDNIMDRRDDAGPIALGRRAATGDRPSDYSIIVYEKGAWVAHMLRGLMMDPATGNDDQFLAMMKEFYGRHRGGTVSTADFQAVVEEYMGGDMGWFFDQWVRGTDIPTYEFAYTTDSTGDGPGLQVRIRQTDVPASFTMIVPVEVELQDGGKQWFRLRVSGRETVGRVPLLGEVKDVEFNAGNAVLARVKTVNW